MTGNVLSTLDWTIFIGSLMAVMALGLWAGRKEDTSEDFYLAGKRTRWWGVAGSIFGSNVSANHMLGMMGVGYAAGFAQSHFEITAIAGMLALCYVFLPVYRKLNVYTLSEYLSRRYNDASRLCYAMIMVAIMVVIQMVPGFYIGSRSFNLLLNSNETAVVKATVDETGAVTKVDILRPGSGYETTPKIEIPEPIEGRAAVAEAVIEGGTLQQIVVSDGGAGYSSEVLPNVRVQGGAVFDPQNLNPGDINPSWFMIGIILMAIVTGTYTILGGLRAVIVTDVIQSVLVLVAGIVVATVTYSQVEVGGWANLVAMDAATGDSAKLHLYYASDHPDLPWSGVLSGLMILHLFYWGTNQFIVQRALSAKSDSDARVGVIMAGFFKLLIPFFSVGCGIAAFYLFEKRGDRNIDQDIVFVKLLTELIVPLKFGIAGLVAAGVIGEILSSLDSMMNSAATILTFDVYKRYFNPNATEKELIRVGRLFIVFSIVGAALLAILTMNPNSKDSFFLQIASHQGRLVAGVVVAFVLGMLWKRATAAGATVCIVLGVILSYAIPPAYAQWLAPQESVRNLFGAQLNFFHTAFVVAVICTIAHVVVSLLTKVDDEKSNLTWFGLGIFEPRTFLRTTIGFLVTLVIYATLAGLMITDVLTPTVAATLAAMWTWAAFIATTVGGTSDGKTPQSVASIFTNDRFWAGLLAAVAIFMMYYFR